MKNKKGNDLKIPIKDDYSIIGQNNLVELNKYKTDYDFIMAEKVKAIAERNKTIYQLYGKKIGDKIIAGEIEIGMDTLAIMYILGKPDDINTTITNSIKENVIDKGYDYIAICSDGAKGTVFHTNSDSIIVDDKIYWTIEGLMEI